ncbi:MAG: DUF4065 domain-containing protein [Bacteroidales bacterium]|nr:DUF4065 domain-containing protein [Bacteroidales bacterium]
MAYSVIDIANKLLLKPMWDDNLEFISNLKLQKLLYYEQGYHLAMFDTPLFDAEIEAWMYGPAIPEVYEKYKCYGRGGIAPDNREEVKLTDEEEELFQEVFDAFKEYSAYGLMMKTHEEYPWASTPHGPGNVISKDKIKSFFKTQLING